MSARDPRPQSGTLLGNLGSMLLVSAVLGVLVAGLAIPFAGVVGIAARNASDSLNQLPEELETQALPQRTRILAADGTPIATIYDENRVNVSLRQVAPIMRKAILSIEDYRFYQHGALDVKGTLRAFITNQATGQTRQGGSSITQQMVKLTLVQQAGQDKEARRQAMEDTFARKLRELRYAIAFEENYSKDWIFERYLNIAYFGDGVYGVQAAARHYFSVDASKLNLQQAATLAGLVKNPVGYDPTTYPDRALTRRNIVLDRMAELNVIPEQKAEKLKARPLGLRITPNRNGCLFSSAAFFCDYVINYLKNDPSLGATRDERERLLESGGLTIRTTLDPRFQKAAQDSVSSHIYAKEQAVGALALVEPRTGAVKAVAQSRPMGNKKMQGETYINYTVPKEVGGARGFQAGSTFKAFVLAQAIKDGIPLNQVIDSPSPKTFQERDFMDCGDKPYGYGSFPIQNSTSSGPKNMYTGTRESVNTFFIALAQETGLCEPYKLAKRMGVQLTNPTGGPEGLPERVPTFTLGIADVTPLEMAEAYATFAGRGLHCDSRPVESISDANDTVVKKYPAKCTQVLPSAVADAVNDILAGVQQPGGFGYQNGINTIQPSAGKTGTTTSQMSVWFVGYTPNLSGAAMLAGANSEGHPVTLVGKSIAGRTLYSASGSGTAGPMWGDAFKAVEQWLDDEQFVPPSSTEIAGVLITVPSVAGMSVSEATRVLENANFTVANGGYVDSGYARGNVAYTSPGGGSQSSSGDTITLYVSDGTPKVEKKNQGKKGKNNRGRNRGNRGNRDD
ncbi:transglycosylase domain-containing protein [Nocardioides daejeonensis]|uniref:transglycosylase domain-containing protein n=1 Tax=Nocardioides daejeonensis TaxID=1046556 RepID=UPI0013A5663E|nr:transglycosylase domain-containing protein [Nocardioides daejeonensis]